MTGVEGWQGWQGSQGVLGRGGGVTAETPLFGMTHLLTYLLIFFKAITDLKTLRNSPRSSRLNNKIMIPQHDLIMLLAMILAWIS